MPARVEALIESDCGDGFALSKFTLAMWGPCRTKSLRASPNCSATSSMGRIVALRAISRSLFIKRADDPSALKPSLHRLRRQT